MIHQKRFKSSPPHQCPIHSKSPESVTRRSVLLGLAGRSVHGQNPAHQKPKPLSKGAVTEDWPAFLGASHNGVSTETKLSRALPPALVWEFAKGTGYASPAVTASRLVYVHRVADEERVECLNPETGAALWQFRYATAFEDRYGYNNGPRSSPVIDGERVYTMGAEGKLHCFELASGRSLWKRDIRMEYRVPQDFFGTASTPLVEGRLLIVNVGAPGGPCVVALDLGPDVKCGVPGRNGARATRRPFQRRSMGGGGCSCLREESRIRRRAGSCRSIRPRARSTLRFRGGADPSSR